METKKTLTRDSIKHDLITHNDADLRFSLTLICIALVIVAIPTAILLCFISLTNSADLTVKIIIGVLLSFFVCFTVWYLSRSLFLWLSEKKMIEKDEFEVAVMTLRDKSTKGSVGARMRGPTTYWLRFDDNKEVEVGSTEYDGAAYGDKFYVVYFKKNKKLRKVYSADRYRLHE